MRINIKQNCLFLWNLIDPIYFQFTRLRFIKNTFGEKTIIRVRVTKYKGEKVTLADGTVINKNDLLLKIHLHNVKLLRQLQKYDSDIKRAFVTYKHVQESLPSIIHYIQENMYTNRIKGLIGITSMQKGCKRLGFEVHTIRSPYYRMFKRISFYPIYKLSSPKGKGIPDPVYLFMSMDGLFKKYKK